MILRRLVIIVAAMLLFTRSMATEKDTLQRWGGTVSIMPGRVLALDKYTRKWIHDKKNISIAAELSRTALPSDSDYYAADYGYPTFSLGLRYTFNDKVRLHRYKDADWGMAEEVDYDSRLGNTISLYGTFARPFFRTKHWETDYTLSFGVGYNNVKYDKENNIDNELIGTRMLIYFGIGLHTTYRFAKCWGVRGGIDFVHHSNGALYRPNKGSNTVGTTLGLVYYPYYETIVNRSHIINEKPFQKYFYLNFTAGLGAKTMLEDWLLTQFGTPRTNPEYRTEDFKLYPAYSVQTDAMYRYARRWASGIGFDLFYGSYASHISDLDNASGHSQSHSPWSLGIAAKHEVFYHNLSLAVSFGFYVFRQMGENAKENETPYYERIGIHYAFEKFGGLSLGVNVKAHRTKADLTEFVIGIPLRIKNVR